MIIRPLDFLPPPCDDYAMTNMNHAHLLHRLNLLADIDDANSMHLRDLLMLDFPFTDHDRIDMTAFLADNRFERELDELDANDLLNSTSMPLAFDAPNATTRRANSQMLQILINLDRDEISRLRLDDSLCPMHACDYAICFDDDDPECAPIRIIFPSHDT